jgi:hypothetical protein
MRNFHVPVKRYSKSILLEICCYLKNLDFECFCFDGNYFSFRKECDAEEWYEIYSYLVKHYKF